MSLVAVKTFLESTGEDIRVRDIIYRRSLQRPLKTYVYVTLSIADQLQTCVKCASAFFNFLIVVRLFFNRSLFLTHSPGRGFVSHAKVKIAQHFVIQIGITTCSSAPMTWTSLFRFTRQTIQTQQPQLS